MILCGGRGTRLRERTESIPKALVEIGGRPILWHVVPIYAAQGFRRFVLCTGYKGEQIESWVRDGVGGGGEIECADTGLDTPTGGRIKAGPGSPRGEPFCATYADGVADIDLAPLDAFHREPGAKATVTVVRPDAQFGVAELEDGGRVLGFEEKPAWTAGSTAASSASSRRFPYLAEDSVLEREPLSAWPPTASSTPSGTRASGTAWTPTRTPCC